VRQQRRQLAGGAVSHKAPPSPRLLAGASVVELTGSMEADAASGQHGRGGRGARWRSSTVERLFFRKGHRQERADAQASREAASVPPDRHPHESISVKNFVPRLSMT
jgi:hypothetical protein